MQRLTLFINEAAAERLVVRATAQRRRPQDEAAVLLERALAAPRDGHGGQEGGAHDCRN